jgi:hypothetical protein
VRHQWHSIGDEQQLGTNSTSRHHFHALGLLRHQQWCSSGTAEQHTCYFGCQHVSDLRGSVCLNCIIHTKAITKVRPCCHCVLLLLLLLLLLSVLVLVRTEQQ